MSPTVTNTSSQICAPFINAFSLTDCYACYVNRLLLQVVVKPSSPPSTAKRPSQILWSAECYCLSNAIHRMGQNIKSFAACV